MAAKLCRLSGMPGVHDATHDGEAVIQRDRAGRFGGQFGMRREDMPGDAVLYLTPAYAPPCL
ncbi:hypothetical protein D3C71_2044810 [compost metagenome]